jgi:hypothetical protein
MALAAIASIVADPKTIPPKTIPRKAARPLVMFAPLRAPEIV